MCKMHITTLNGNFTLSNTMMRVTKRHGYPHKPHLTGKEINKLWIALVIEQTIYNVGGKIMLDSVNSRLEKYHLGISDCVDNPSTLINILDTICGKPSITCKTIIKSLNKNLEEFYMSKSVQKFTSGL